MKIHVTTPQYDNIAKVLKSINVNYSSFKGKYDCDLLFINCGTADSIDLKLLNEFVKKGGTVYASDLTSSLMTSSFPSLFTFKGNVGQSRKMKAKVIDDELKAIIGETVSVNFDMGGWSVLGSIKSGKIILESDNGMPIMVHIPFGKGNIFYTCFHNHAQASKKESILLRLLVLKQISQAKSSSIEKVSEALDINLSDYKKEFFGSFTNNGIQEKVAEEINTSSKIEGDSLNTWNKLKNVTKEKETNPKEQEEESKKNNSAWNKFKK